MALEQLSFFWTVFRDVRERITGHNKDTAEAHGTILKAFSHTYNYLRNNQGSYVPDMELADL